MKIKIISSVVAAVLALAVSTALACPYESKSQANKGETTAKVDAKAKGGCKKGCDGKCGCKKGAKLTANKSDAGSTIRWPLTGEPIAEEDCPVRKAVDAVLASMPAMKYRVGEDITGCSKSAGAMAEKAGKPIKYLVGEEVLSDKAEAVVKLTALLEKEAQTLRTMRFVAGGKCHLCPMTAKSVAKKTNTKVAYRVGGVDFVKKEDAGKALESIKEALAEVKMGYKVGGTTYRCDKTAGAKAEETHKKLTFVIGDEETCCDKTANLMLTEAKVRKIVEAAVTTSLSL